MANKTVTDIKKANLKGNIALVLSGISLVGVVILFILIL